MKLDKDIFHDGKVHRLPPEKCGPSHVSLSGIEGIGKCDFKIDIKSLTTRYGDVVAFDPPLKAGEVLRYSWDRNGIVRAVCEGHKVEITIKSPQA